MLDCPLLYFLVPSHDAFTYSFLHLNKSIPLYIAIYSSFLLNLCLNLCYCLSLSLSACVSACLSVCLSVFVYDYVSVYLSTCLSLLPSLPKAKTYLRHFINNSVPSLNFTSVFQLRLTPQLARFMVKTPALHRLSSTVTAVIIFFSVFSSILSTFGYIQFIPAVFALSGAATAWTSYSQTDLVLVQTNAAINQLNQLVIWWDALSMIEKRVGANKEFMVRTFLLLF